MTRPLRIVDFGNSISVLQVPAGATRADRTFPELLAGMLGGAGVAAVAANEGRLHDFVHTGLRRYERHLRVHAPDVVILHYGVLEAQPWFGPLRLLRHVIRRNWTMSRAAKAYRRYIVKYLWDALSWYRERLAPIIGSWTWQVSPRRFRHGMATLLRLLRDDLRPLVLVLAIAPAPEMLERRVPGQAARSDRYNTILREVVAESDYEDVQFVEIADLVEALGGADDHLVDGLHFTPALHRAVAVRLTELILQRFPEGVDSVHAGVPAARTEGAA